MAKITYLFVQSSSAAFVARPCPYDSVQQMMSASGWEPVTFSKVLFDNLHLTVKIR
jgi:hypothetical protein